MQRPNPIPPWVHPNEDETALLASPTPAVPNSRHYRPPPPKHYKPGRKWDHLRTEEPALLSQPIAESQARWRSFMESGPNPVSHGARVVSPAWMEEHMPHLRPNIPPTGETRQPAQKATEKGLKAKGKWLISPERQERTVRLFWHLLLRNPYVPLIFRMTTLAFTAAALGIAGSLYHNIRRVSHLTQTESSRGCINAHQPQMTPLDFRRFAKGPSGQLRRRPVQPVR